MLNTVVIRIDYKNKYFVVVGKHRYTTEHRKNLAPRLANRSKGSIEFKHQNISAVMIDLGLPYIDGYKPRGNYQGFILCKFK